MKVEDFNYELPAELIAQTPLANRSNSRLMVMDRYTGAISHQHFYDIINMLSSNDCLVLNNTKVLPSRIYGKKTDTDATIELLLLKEHPGYWEVLARPARRLHVGTIIDFNGLMQAEVLEKLDDGVMHVRFIYQGIFLEVLEKVGEMPLPPYIHEKLKDQSRYQTIYAQELGSAAAPTAGLHFTSELLDQLREKGVTICYVTLHIGLGTFRSVMSDEVEEHHMHSEHYFISPETADTLNQAIIDNKRIISVGTTSTRTLESAYKKYGKIVSCSEDTDIFIYPGFQFKVVDALITNFHLPKSSLVMLVSAFASREMILNAYKEAIDNRYRFFSFGDAMFIKGEKNGH